MDVLFKFFLVRLGQGFYGSKPFKKRRGYFVNLFVGGLRRQNCDDSQLKRGFVFKSDLGMRVCLCEHGNYLVGARFQVFFRHLK